MVDIAEVRNSRILGVFDEILHSSAGSLVTVEIIGTGIAAEARCTLTVLAGKVDNSGNDQANSAGNPLAHVDLLMELGSIEGDLVELWSRQCSGDLDAAGFEAGIRGIVSRLEAWPQLYVAGCSE